MAGPPQGHRGNPACEAEPGEGRACHFTWSLPPPGPLLLLSRAPGQPRKGFMPKIHAARAGRWGGQAQKPRTARTALLSVQVQAVPSAPSQTPHPQTEKPRETKAATERPGVARAGRPSADGIDVAVSLRRSCSAETLSFAFSGDSLRNVSGTARHLQGSGDGRHVSKSTPRRDSGRERSASRGPSVWRLRNVQKPRPLPPASPSWSRARHREPRELPALDPGVRVLFFILNF